MENVKATLTEVKESTRQLLGKRVELYGGHWVLVGAVLFMAGIIIGMLIAPITRGIQISLFANNGNNSGNNNGNNGTGNRVTFADGDEKDDKNKEDSKNKKNKKENRK